MTHKGKSYIDGVFHIRELPILTIESKDRNLRPEISIFMLPSKLTEWWEFHSCTLFWCKQFPWASVGVEITLNTASMCSASPLSFVLIYQCTTHIHVCYLRIWCAVFSAGPKEKRMGRCCILLQTPNPFSPRSWAVTCVVGLPCPGPWWLKLSTVPISGKPLQQLPSAAEWNVVVNYTELHLAFSEIKNKRTCHSDLLLYYHLEVHNGQGQV